MIPQHALNVVLGKASLLTVENFVKTILFLLCSAQIAVNTMREYDVDGDDKLNLEEFKNLLSTTDLQSKFAVNMP